MASPFASRIARIVKEGVTPLLRVHGFRKAGSVYVVEQDDVVWIVDVQKSRWNDEVEAQFTINGGVYIPGVISGYSGRPDPANPKIVDCCLSVRIGMLSESRLDKWWKVTASDDSEGSVDKEIARELREQVENLLLPFLENFRCPADVAMLLENTRRTLWPFVAPQSAAQRCAYASLVYAGMGNNAKAVSVMEQALRQAEAEGFPLEAEVIERLSERVLSA